MTRTTTVRVLRAAAALTAVVLALSAGLAASTVRWAVHILPSGGGQVVWATSSPARNGTLTRSGTITFDNGALVDLTFQPANGYELVRVTKNGTDWTNSLDGAGHFQFGPVDSAHLFLVTFSALTPTGTFQMYSQVGNPAITQMVDVSGHYEGVSPTSHARDYAFDVAMDDAGKLAVMGTLEGVEPAGGGDITGSAGGVRTVNGQPTIDSRGKFNGTRDGAAVNGSASFQGPAQINDDGVHQTVDGSLGYKAKVDGVPFADRNVPVTTEVPPGAAGNISANWQIRVDIRKEVLKTRKPKVYASGLLRLPNGDEVRFAEKRVKYSTKKGYTLRFLRGTNETRVPSVLDKRSKVTITKMTLTQVGDRWEPSGGSLSYAFLGQKGKGNLVDFLSD